MNREKRFLILTVGGLVVGLGIVMGGLTGCASTHGDRKSNVTKTDVKVARLEARLRRANARIETLRERNWVLKKRIKLGEVAATVAATVASDVATETLDGFRPGVELDVPIRATSPKVKSRREDVSLKLPRKSMVPVQERMTTSPGEQADKVLARTVSDLLKAGDVFEADRTATLLEKSYPNSEFVAETRFQQGLHYYRKKDLPQADRFFQAALVAPRSHVRARAGAALMRGIIARRVATEGVKEGRSQSVTKSNFQLSRQSFEYVRKRFPGSSEAKRAGRELSAMNLSTGMK